MAGAARRAFPTHVTGDKLAAVYRYLNWMYEGWLGAQIMRQGYYVANGKKLLSWIQKNGSQGSPAFTKAEYDFWYLGKPAPRDLPGITGKVGDIKKGQVPRRRVVRQAVVQVHRLELVLRAERVPGEEVQRVPQRVGHDGTRWAFRGGGTRRPL